MTTITPTHEAPASPPRTILVEEYYMARQAFANVPVFHIDQKITHISIAKSIGPTMYGVRYGENHDTHYLDGSDILYTLTPWSANDMWVTHE